MNGAQIHAAWIDDFWSHFGGGKNTGAKYKKKVKLAQLQRMSEVTIDYKQHIDRSVLRERFDRVKFHRHSLVGHPRCFVCREPAEVRHHIIQ